MRENVYLGKNIRYLRTKAKLEQALAIRDNPKLKLQKATKTAHTGSFDDLWCNYIT